MKRYGILLVLAACGAEDDPKEPEAPPSSPTCGLNEFRVEGTVDGQAWSLLWQGGVGMSYMGGESFDVSQTGTGNALSLAIDGTGRKKDLPARGFITSDENGAVGNCDSGDYDSRFWDLAELSEEKSIYAFSLRHLRAEPYCDGPELSGHLDGCIYLGPP
jgi:hypothetical protein